MKKSLKFLTENLSYVLLSAFWLVALMNPVFKKYDYGAGFPMTIVFCVLVAVVAFFEFRKKREKVFWEKAFLLIFAAAIAASFVFSQTKNLGFSEVLAFISMVPLYFLFAYKKNEWAGSFLRIVGFGTILAVIVGYFIYFAKPEVRMFGPFFNIFYHSNVWPNAFALFLLMAWPVFMLLAGKKSRWQTAVLIGFVLSALLLTYSRGALIVLGGQAVLMLIYFFKRIRWKAVFLVGLTILTAGVFFFGANAFRSMNHETVNIEERITFGNSESLTSAQERVDFWLGAVELIKEKPLFGWGPFSFRQAYNGIQKTFLGNADHPHNLFLKIGAENGLIALGAFLVFLISIFAVVVKRFPRLSRVKKDSVYILGVSVLGGFAHNMIDYNLNFMVNLVTLFIFIILIRSLVAKAAAKERRAVLGLVLAVIVGLMAVYEGGILVLSKVVDESYTAYSFFPRNYYLNMADETIKANDFDTAFHSTEKEIELNPLDSQAWYLKGVLYCDENNPDRNITECRDDLEKAIELNGMNEMAYYADYFRIFAIFSDRDPNEMIQKTLELLNIYFDYVGNNVHFTAYTGNVEATAELIDLLVPYLPAKTADELLVKKQKMLETAERLRNEKTY
ncbi:MAG: O-antigen ligase family protein [Candidatus Peregrinibacteria bacterium]